MSNPNGRPRKALTKKICELKKGESFKTSRSRPVVVSLANRAQSKIFDGKRQFSTSQLAGQKKVTVIRVA